MNRARRKNLSLHTEERAVIRTFDLHQDVLTESKHYVTTLDVGAAGLLVYSSTLVPVGEVLHIDVSLQGMTEPCTLKGVARSAHRSDNAYGYVIEVDVLADNSALHWRRQFH
ncbi:MAG: hypothetical protein ACM3ZT_06240 [Bacillota bacterium]